MTTDNSSRQLRRRTHDRLVGGVCGGLADHFGVDIAVVRIAFVLLTVFGGAGLALYIAAWLLIPAQNEPRSVAERLLGR